MKIKGKWEYVIEPKKVIVVEEKEDIVEEVEKYLYYNHTTFNSYWYYFYGEWVGGMKAIVTANDGSIWVAGDGGRIARWNGIKWIDEGQWCHGELAITDLVVSKDGSIWAMGWDEKGKFDKRKIWETIKGDYICKVARWDGEKWEDMSIGRDFDRRNRFLFVTPEGDIQIVNNGNPCTEECFGGYAQRWDGNKWVDIGEWFPGEGEWEIYDGVVALDGSIWVAGLDGKAARWDGKKWEEIDLWPQRSHGDINALAASEDGIVWAGGDDGYLAYWDGYRWVNCKRWFCESHWNKKMRDLCELVINYIKDEYPAVKDIIEGRYEYEDYCDDIADITVAKDGSIWAVTYDGDIARWTYEIVEK